jgi:anti-sigma factor RsiW
MTPADHQPAHDVRCREFVELITDLLEGALAVEERDVVERHLAMCTWCQTYVDQMRDTLTVLGRLGADGVPVQLVEALTGAFRLEHAARRGG